MAAVLADSTAGVGRGDLPARAARALAARRADLAPREAVLGVLDADLERIARRQRRRADRGLDLERDGQAVVDDGVGGAVLALAGLAAGAARVVVELAAACACAGVLGDRALGRGEDRRARGGGRFRAVCDQVARRRRAGGPVAAATARQQRANRR